MSPTEIPPGSGRHPRHEFQWWFSMSGTPKYDDPDWLEEQYHQHGLTLQDIADKTTVSETTIFRRMEAFEIDRGEYQQEQNLPSSRNRPLSPRINSYGHREFTE